MSTLVTFEKRYTLDELKNLLKELKESGQCPVKDPKFYESWDMVEFGTDEYKKKFVRNVKN
jgi:hypothetical protein